jgi:hypothetical protein
MAIARRAADAQAPEVPPRREREPAVRSQHLVDAVAEGEAVVQHGDPRLLGWGDDSIDGGEKGHVEMTPGRERIRFEPRVAPERGHCAEHAVSGSSAA